MIEPGLTLLDAVNRGFARNFGRSLLKLPFTPMMFRRTNQRKRIGPPGLSQPIYSSADICHECSIFDLCEIDLDVCECAFLCRLSQQVAYN